jgi:hypothetical protein
MKTIVHLRKPFLGGLWLAWLTEPIWPWFEVSRQQNGEIYVWLRRLLVVLTPRGRMPERRIVAAADDGAAEPTAPASAGAAS